MDSMNPKIGYNRYIGGQNGWVGSDHPMYGKIGKNNPNYGKPFSEERKQNISKSLIGLLSGEKHPMYGIYRFGFSNPKK